MKDFVQRNLAFLGIAIGTIVLIVGGVFVFAKNNSGSTDTKKISSDILVPVGVNQTNPNALVTLVEFGDYQCPACGVYHPLVKRLLSEFPGKINFVFRNFPLSQHINANITSYAAEAAGLQGKFWQMHDKIYESQNIWSNSDNAKDILINFAKDLDLNIDQFKTDVDSDKVKEKIKKDVNDGNLTALNATPTFYLNGYKLKNPAGYDEFKRLVQDAINKNPAD